MERGKTGKGGRDRRLSAEVTVTPVRAGDGSQQRIDRMQASFTWRDELLNDVLKVAAPAGVALTGLVIGFRSPIRLDLAAASVLAAATLVVALRLLPRLAFRARATLTVLIVYASALPSVLRSGFALSSGGVMMAAIVLGVILLGRGAAISLLATTAGILVWLGWRAKAGHFVPYPLESDPHLARNWYRMAIGMDIVAATLTSVVASAVRHIETNYAEVSSALALLTGEQRRRAALERDRQRVDRDWARPARELGVLAQNGDVAAGNTGAVFAALAEAGTRSLDVERCGIWLFDQRHRELRCRDLFGRDKGLHTHDLRLSATAAPTFFAAVEAGRVIAADRAGMDTRTQEMGDRYLEPFGIASLLGAPIRVQGRVVGLVCGEQIGTPVVWSDAQQRFAESLAEVAARTISAADHASRVLALRASTEELADMVQALKVRMVGIPSGIAEWDNATEPHALGAVDGVLERMRHVSSELRAPSLDEVGLMTALRANLDAKAAASGVSFDLNASKEIGTGSPVTEAACYWIVEALAANIIARTDTELVQIRLERDQGQLRVTVEDDGWGTPTNPGVPIWGRGPIARVREQAREIGGSVEVTVCEGAGSLVEIRLPDPPLARLPRASERPEPARGPAAPLAPRAPVS